MSARRLTTAEVSERFEQLAEAVRELTALNQRRDLIYATQRKSGSVVQSGVNPNPGDPTSNLATQIADLRPQWDAEEEALLAVIGEGRELCQGIGHALGVSYGLAMEYHYLWCLPWKQVATMLDVSKSSAYKMRSDSIEYVREVGYKGAMDGRKPRVVASDAS